jgi:hypothetical protein
MEEQTQPHASDQSGQKPHVTIYFVDNEPQTTTEKSLTVKEILVKAMLDPANHYLIELRGDHQIDHKDLDKEIKIHEHQKFISVFTGETPLS